MIRFGLGTGPAGDESVRSACPPAGPREWIENNMSAAADVVEHYGGNELLASIEAGLTAVSAVLLARGAIRR